MSFVVPNLQKGVAYFDARGRANTLYHTYWQKVSSSIGGQFDEIALTQADLAATQTDLASTQADLALAQADLATTVTDLATLLGLVLGLQAGTEEFSGLLVNAKLVSNFMAGLDANGERIVESFAFPLNVPSGSARSYAAQPLSSDDTNIYVAAVGYDEPGGSGSLVAGSMSGLSPDTTYRVFYNPVSAFYSAQPPPAGAFFSSPDGWQYIGDIKTSNAGVYSPPATPPPGIDPFFFNGGMVFYY